MFDAALCHVTPVDAGSYVQEWRQPPATLFPTVRRGQSTMTEFSAFRDGKPQFFDNILLVTPLGEEKSSADSVANAQEVEVVRFDLLTKTIADRAFLLARKYGAGVDREESSRLEILTERLRRLSPRVTAAHTDELAHTVGRIEERAAQLSEIMQRYSTA